MVKNKIVLITGGTKGIGFKTAELFASNGATVYMNYSFDKEQADKAYNELKGKSYSCDVIRADVGIKKDVEEMVKKIVNKHGRIDILVNNASPKLVLKPFEKLNVNELENDLNVILKGAFFLCKVIVPYMKKQKYGRIVNVLSTSIIGKVPSYMVSYIISKSALFGFTKSLAVELGSHNITVNSVSPGFTETDFIKDVPHKVFEFYKENLPIKRLASTYDVARTILFLCSNDSDYLTGVDIPICGGGVM